MNKEGQISIEYLIVVGFVTFLVIAILGIAFFYASGTKDRVRMNQITSFASKVISSSESVYYSGEPSKVTITAYLPQGIQNLEIIEDSLVFSVITGSGLSVISFSSDVPLIGELSETEGVKKIEVIAQENGVFLSD